MESHVCVDIVITLVGNYNFARDSGCPWVRARSDRGARLTSKRQGGGRQGGLGDEFVESTCERAQARTHTHIDYMHTHTHKIIRVSSA